MTGSSISGGPSQTYTYDANSNRLSWNDGTATTTYDYNEADELTAQHRSGVDRTYAYDAYGNMTSSAVATSGATAYTYDAQDRVKTITPPSGGALSFTLDALRRHWTKSVGGTLSETYGYIGASEAVARIDQTSGSVSAAIDAAGNRVATTTSAGGFGWSLPDLHGNVAAALGSSGSSVSDAFRYSAYGTTLAKTTSTLPTPWRFQGRLSLNTDDGSGVNTDLYDFVARAYDPGLAAFTSLDNVAGSAQNPLTLNRFLYALASPTTLIDPDGHYVINADDTGTFSYVPTATYRPRPTPLQVSQIEQFSEQQAMKTYTAQRNAPASEVVARAKTASIAITVAQTVTAAARAAQTTPSRSEAIPDEQLGWLRSVVDYVTVGGTVAAPSPIIVGPAVNPSFTYTRTGHLYFTFGVGAGVPGVNVEARGGHIFGPRDSENTVDSFVEGWSVTGSGMLPIEVVGPSGAVQWGNPPDPFNLTGTARNLLKPRVSVELGAGAGTPTVTGTVSYSWNVDTWLDWVGWVWRPTW